MRKALLLAGLSMVVGLLFFQAAWAHPSPHGPHNHNNNSYMDLYKTQSTWWNGAFAAARHNYGDEETEGLNVAPLPQVVSSIAQADVEVIHQPCVADNNSESFFMPRSGGPDLVSVGECVDYPIWITTHEFQHSYGFPHPDCGTIGSDPDYPNRKSILCRLRWYSGDLTRHDKVDLRNIPNEWQGNPHDSASSASSTDLPEGARPVTEENYDEIVPPRLQRGSATPVGYYVR